ARPAVTEWFDRRLSIVHDRAAEPTTTPGDDCGTCAVVAACPEHRRGAHYGRRRDLLPGILHVTPTNLDTWRRCPREWRNACLFGIPSSDTDPGTVHGQQMHDVLRLVHERGTCRDRAHVDDVLESHGFADNERMRAELARHTTRCPTPADALGHEVTRARFGPHPTAPFMATARLDALWVHDGILDVRDYKTGRVWTDRVADDSQARLQAWVVAPLAERLGLRVRITFEHLATEVLDDPEPFEPDADDLRAIEDELRCEVVAIRSEVDFAGVADARAGGGGGMTRTSRGRMLWWGATKRCARCGSGHLFRRYFTMVDDCQRCGLHFEREQGYWAGALAINIGLAGAVFIVAFAVALVLTVPDVPVVPLLAILVPLMIVVPTLGYPFSKTIWVAVDRAFLQHLDP